MRTKVNIMLIILIAISTVLFIYSCRKDVLVTKPSPQSSTPSTQNYIVNGSFENGLQGWNAALGNTFSIFTSTFNPHPITDTVIGRLVSDVPNAGGIMSFLKKDMVSGMYPIGTDDRAQIIYQYVLGLPFSSGSNLFNFELEYYIKNYPYNHVVQQMYVGLGIMKNNTLKNCVYQHIDTTMNNQWIKMKQVITNYSLSNSDTLVLFIGVNYYQVYYYYSEGMLFDNISLKIR